MTGRLTALFAASWSLMSHCVGEELIADIQQGTNMALAIAPDRETLVIDLLGQLWELPVTGGAASPLTPTDEPARNPRYSPDGGSLVYQRETAGQWDLWLFEPANGISRQLTGPPYNELDPDFTPDGKVVIFSSDRAGSFDIWELQLDSQELSQLSRGEGQASFPTVSDLRDIVYVNQRGNHWTLELLRSDGSSITLLEAPHPLRAPSWRPGGGVILFTEQPDSTASNLKMIVLSEQPVIKTLTQGEDVFGFRAAWLSPAEYLYTADGRIWSRTLANAARSPILLFAGVGVTRASHPLRISGHAPVGPQRAQGIRAARDSPSRRYRAFTALGDLWLQDTDNDLRQLTNDIYVDIDPSFGADETSIVFASDRAGEMNLWQLSLETNELSQLTTAPGKSYRPTVSPDGTQVAFLRTQGFGPWSESSLELLNLAPRGRPRTLADGLTAASTPIWDLDGNGVSVTTTQPVAPGGRRPGPAVVHVDLADGTERAARDTDPIAQPPDQVMDAEFASPMIEWTPAEPDNEFVVQVDRLFDGLRTQYRRHMDIHVRNGRITNVIARGLAPLPDTVIDARDYTIIPGLIDIHAHQSALSGERIGRIWLAYGITTVRELSGDPGDGLERQESWASGKRVGPRLLLTSVQADDAAGTGGDRARRNYDVLELYSSEPGRFTGPSLQEARTLGLPIFSDRLLPAARFGINGLEHIGSRSMRPYGLERSSLDKSYQDVLSILTQTRTAVTPTLAAFGGFSRLAAGQRLWSAETAYVQFYHGYERTGWQEAPTDAVRVPLLQQTIATLVRAGGRVAAGSDAPAVPYGLGLHAELALLGESGLANDQVLRFATADAALALGLERDIGTLETGKLADFVVLSGDPLTRITDSLRIEAVVKGGVWYERQDLLAPR